jgi:hypothetical protein
MKAHKVVESTAPFNFNLDTRYGRVVSFNPRPQRRNPFTAISKFKWSFYALFQNMNLKKSNENNYLTTGQMGKIVRKPGEINSTIN